MTRVEFTLEIGKGKDNRITIPEEARCLFPDAEGEFTIKSDAVEDKVRVKCNKKYKKPHIHLTKTKWFEAHRGKLKDGERLVIEVTESKLGMEYRLISPKEQKEVA